MKKILLILLMATVSFSSQAQFGGPDPGFEGPEAYVTFYMCAQENPNPGGSPIVLYSGFGYINIADEIALCDSQSTLRNTLFYGPPPSS